MIYNQILSRLKEYLDKPSEYRSFVLYSHDWDKKREIARRIADELMGIYIDFLSEKITGIYPEIGLFSHMNLKRDIEGWSKHANTILVIDEIEALFDTWRKKEQEDFFKMISRWRPESVVLISIAINLNYEEVLGRDRVFRISMGGT
jgi:hypothetical protein